MKIVKSWHRSSVTSLRFVGMLTLSCTLPIVLFAVGPVWWTEQGVLDTNQSADSFAVINQGQLKKMAMAAFYEFETKLVDGPGGAVTGLMNRWTQLDAANQRVPKITAKTADYDGVNLGQLKATAAVFYDRMGAPYPWTAATNDDDDFALANIGQLKKVFAFEVITIGDTDHNGLPDDWERNYFGRIGVDPNADADGDLISNLDEMRMGLSPNVNNSATSVQVLSYDALSRLKNAGPVTYGYDAEGNIQSVAN